MDNKVFYPNASMVKARRLVVWMGHTTQNKMGPTTDRFISSVYCSMDRSLVEREFVVERREKKRKISGLKTGALRQLGARHNMPKAMVASPLVQSCGHLRA